MAVYTFRCRKCPEKVEVEHAIDEPHPTHHAGCGGELVRTIGAMPNVIYRAGGFYTTDSRLDTHSDDE